MRRLLVVVLVLGMLVGCSSGVSQEEYDAVVMERNLALTDYESLSKAFADLEEEYDALRNEYIAFKAEAAPFLKMSADEQAAEMARAEQSRIEAEEAARIAQEEADRVAAEKAEEEAQRLKEEEEARIAEEAKGYETGITFEDLARSPDDYKGKKVKFTGYALQIIEGYYRNEMRMSTDGRYDDVIYCSYDPDGLEVRILEEDEITIYGVSNGLKTYETIMGGTVTLPQVTVDRIEIH